MRGNKGITLTELIVAIAIFGILSIPISIILINGIQGINKQNDNAMAMHYARNTMEMIIDDLRSNQDNNTNVTGSILNVNGSINYNLVNGKLLKNGEDVINDNTVSINRFVCTISDNVISITLDMQYGKYGSAILSSSFSKKL